MSAIEILEYAAYGLAIAGLLYVAYCYGISWWITKDPEP